MSPTAEERAGACPFFRPDVEEEWAAEEPISCLNCYFRRWESTDSFQCMAGRPSDH